MIDVVHGMHNAYPSMANIWTNVCYLSFAMGKLPMYGSK